MKIDLTNCKTPEDVDRALKPLGEVMGAIRSALAKVGGSPSPTIVERQPEASRAYLDGQLHGALIQVARMARLHLKHNCRAGTTALTGALFDLEEAELAAGVDLTSLTALLGKPPRKATRPKSR